MESQKQLFHFLIIEEGKDKRLICLEQNVCKIGRGLDNTILLKMKGVSRYHAHLCRIKNPEDETYSFQIFDGDLQGNKSTNGLLVNGKRRSSYRLQHGDYIQFCKGVSARYYSLNGHSCLNPNPSDNHPEHPDLRLEYRDALLTEHCFASNEADVSELDFFRLSSFLELLPTPIIEINLDGTITYCNLAGRQQFPSLLRDQTQHPVLVDLAMTFQQEGIQSIIREVKTEHKVYEQFAYRIQKLDLIRSYLFDVTERKQTETALSKSQAKEKALLHAIPDLILDLNSDGMIRGIKPASDLKLAIFSEDCVQQHVSELLPTQVAQQIMRALRRAVSTHETQTFDCKLNIAHQPLYCDVRVVWIADDELLAIVRNITAQKTFEKQLLYDALHDPLTGLPNRQLFFKKVENAIQRSKRCQGTLFAVLFVDLDRFKVINDSLGHLAGDQLLVKIAHKLKSCLRRGDMVARLGGDEFAVLLRNLKSIYEATEVTERLQKTLSLPLQVGPHEIFVSASVGIASSQLEYEHPEELLRDADTAMYHAKSRGRARHEQFNQTMHTQMMGVLQLDRDLRRAIERQEFELYYQPIVSLVTGTITGFEALIRWQHPQKGLIAPDAFIPLAEETGLIIPMGEWVLSQACQQLYRWQEEFPKRALTMSINLSGKQFTHPQLVSHIQRTLDQIRVCPNALKLEMTESIVMDNTHSSKETLQKLRDLGLQLCIDDFGTGYSSLSYLHRFPIQTLKVDRSFVSRMDMTDENSSIAITQTITTLAHQLGINIVAEGIETATQLDLVKTFRCEYGQGYFFSKPLNSHQAEDLIVSQPQW